jgi:hypothetical protein
MFLDITRRPVYISKHDVSETGFCLRLQVKSSNLGPIDRANLYLQTRIQSPKLRIVKYTEDSGQCPET